MRRTFVGLCALAALALVLGPVSPPERALKSCRLPVTRNVQGRSRSFRRDSSPNARRLLRALPERFEPVAGQGAQACPARKQNGPAVFSVMLAPGSIVRASRNLPGRRMDIRLMEQVMRERGVNACAHFKCRRHCCDARGHDCRHGQAAAVPA